MFVLRYLVVSILVLVAACAWGMGQELSGWQIAGLAFAASVAMQVMVVLMVMVMAMRPLNWPKPPLSARADQLAVSTE